ncbi:putative nucleotidyltransferase [Arcicella rosea]|uniref:nucleotidyltransferase family protein n=1 Tax=Arcicella rosea TaxID=502909 RepID=UPI00345CE4C5
MQYGLTNKQLNEILDIITANPAVEEAILFGSRAKGNYRKGSDVDIALKGENLTLTDVLHIDNQLDDTYLPYTFDIILYRHINDPDVIEHINRVGIDILKKAEIQHE